MSMSKRLAGFLVLFGVIILFCTWTRTNRTGVTSTNTVGVKIDTVNPTTESVTTEQSSVLTEPSADTGGSRRITFTVSPRLGSGTNGQ